MVEMRLKTIKMPSVIMETVDLQQVSFFLHVSFFASQHAQSFDKFVHFYDLHVIVHLHYSRFASSVSLPLSYASVSGCFCCLNL